MTLKPTAMFTLSTAHSTASTGNNDGSTSSFNQQSSTHSRISIIKYGSMHSLRFCFRWIRSGYFGKGLLETVSRSNIF